MESAVQAWFQCKSTVVQMSTLYPVVKLREQNLSERFTKFINIKIKLENLEKRFSNIILIIIS